MFNEGGGLSETLETQAVPVISIQSYCHTHSGLGLE